MEAEPASRGTEDLCLLSAGQSAARAKGRPRESSSHGPGRPETGGKPPRHTLCWLEETPICHRRLSKAASLEVIVSYLVEDFESGTGV